MKNDLAERVNKSSESILIASHINNINIRGRLIEALITADDYERKDLMYKLANEEESFPIYQTKNELGDFQYDFVNEITYTDIKTKIVYLDSNPKAFNIDKFLKMMIKTNTIFLFYLIGINETQIMNTSLLSVYDTQLVSSSVIQPHWSGRNSRGTVQFIGAVLNKILNDKSYKSKIDINKATVFLKKLIK